MTSSAFLLEGGAHGREYVPRTLCVALLGAAGDQQEVCHCKRETVSSIVQTDYRVLLFACCKQEECGTETEEADNECRRTPADCGCDAEAVGGVSEEEGGERKMTACGDQSLLFFTDEIESLTLTSWMTSISVDHMNLAKILLESFQNFLCWE